MILVLRWWYFAGIAGIAATAFGCIETKLAFDSGAEPTPVTIEQLSTGVVPTQPWVRLGPHVALLDHAVWLESRGRVRSAFHPVVAESHPYIEAWRVLAKRYARVEDVPVGQLPLLDSIRVLVQTKTKPANASRATVEGVEGMLFSGSTLSPDERDLVEDRLSVRDVQRLLVLEAGRRPWPVAVAIGTTVLGLLTIVWAIRRFRRPATG